MKREVRDLWVAELRSDRHVQGIGALEDPSTGERCCLGVLARIAVDAGVVTEVTRKRGLTAFDGNSLTLPPSVWLWAGLPDSNPDVDWPLDPDGPPKAVALGEINDTGRASFAVIADLIEDQL